LIRRKLCFRHLKMTDRSNVPAAKGNLFMMPNTSVLYALMCSYVSSVLDRSIMISMSLYIAQAQIKTGNQLSDKVPKKMILSTKRSWKNFKTES